MYDRVNTLLCNGFSMSEEYTIPEFVVKLALEFKAIRVIDNRMVPTHWKLLAEVLYNEVEEDEALTYDTEIKIAFAKIKFWLQHVLNGSLLISSDNEWAYGAFFDEDGRTTTGNNTVLLPSDPTDDLISEIIHSKMNAFGGDAIEFGIIELTSDDENGLSFMFTGHGESNLPEMKDWVGERAYFDKPWWARDDASTFDIIPNDDADLEVKPASAYSLDFIRKQFEKKSEEGAVIIRPSFRPTVIEGGKE